MASIGDLFFSFRGDDAALQVDAGKAGDKAGQTLGQRLSGGAKAGLVAVGAAGGALFGIAAKGGAELTQTVAQFRAQTGATAEEAEAAQASISRLYQGNIEGFAQLGATLAAVRTNLGLTGAEGEAAAGRILDFARVTGQDAVAATGQLDDIMDSLNLSYEQGSVVLDQLVASQQRFGGTVSGSAAALAALAPALNAANLSVDDGIGLLNLFAASGLDAAAAPAALTRALRSVESPAELQKLIDDINATADPFERAAKASDLFGAKAGAKLANALDGVDFGAFIIGADDAGGAIENAAAAIDESPFNRLQLAIRQVTGPLGEIGTQFGPLILGLSQLGGPLISAATAGIGGLAGRALPMLTTGLAGLLPALAGTLAAVGTGIGSLIAAAIPVGMALLPVILIAALVAALAFLIANPEIVGQIAAFVGSLLDAIADFLGTLGEVFARAFRAAVEAVSGAVGRIGDILGAVAGHFTAL
ncbi:MAG TPA: phage tail tape measure protein, partial [Patescibacteria group bacterium]|nr:phage tail tape measure protein [Patescibacteria group bacterium]